MQDKLEIELTKEEHDCIKDAIEKFIAKLEKMSKEERLQFFKKICYEKNLNFEKEINGTIYQINSHFSEKSKETVLNKVERLLLK